MSSDVRVRRLQKADAEGVASIYLQSARHHAAIDPERYVVPLFDEVVKRYREGGQHPDPVRGVTFVAVCGREVAGFVDGWLQHPMDLMHRPCTYCYIAEIAVAESMRSSGIGTLLMRAIEDWGRQLGATFASLDYNTNNPRAGAFYRDRMGYRSASSMMIKPL